MKLKPRTLWISVLTLAIVVSVLWMVPILVRSLSYKEAFPRKFPTWQGVINVWQISSWRVAKSSKSIVLSKTAKGYEKRNIGLFVEVENISEETYRMRLASGQVPDMLSYPAELGVNLDDYVTIPLDQKLLPIHQAAYEASGKKAVPWLHTMPLIIVNADLASRRGVDYVDQITWAYFEELSEELKYGKDTHSWRGSACNMLGAIYGGKMIAPPASQTPWEAFSSFSQRDDAMIWGGIWEAAAMERLNERGKGFTSAVRMPPSDVPTLAWSQCLSVHGGDEGRAAMAVDFINIVLSDKVQESAAEATSCMAVTDAGSHYSDVRKELLKANDVVTIIPGSGLSRETILLALGGDEVARQQVIACLVNKDYRQVSNIPEAEEGG